MGGGSHNEDGDRVTGRGGGAPWGREEKERKGERGAGSPPNMNSKGGRGAREREGEKREGCEIGVRGRGSWNPRVQHKITSSFLLHSLPLKRNYISLFIGVGNLSPKELNLLDSRG